MCRSGQTGRTQDPLAYAYAGSNPVICISHLQDKNFKLRINFSFYHHKRFKAALQRKLMGDYNDLNLENTSPRNSKMIILSESNELKEFPSEIFVSKLETLVGQKAITYPRILVLLNESLKEFGKDSGEIFEYFSLIEQAQKISERYFGAINYSRTPRGYVLQK